MSAPPASEQEGSKVTHHFGRGGAGNTTKKPVASPGLPPAEPKLETTPLLRSKNYTTGRGGTGNIVENTNPETARIAQDVDVPGITLPEGDHHVGRGGGGNVKKLDQVERDAARENNAKLRSASFSKDRGALQGLKNKAKDILKPNDKE